MKCKKKEIVQDSSNTEIKALRNKVKLLSKVCRKCKHNIGKSIKLAKGNPIVKILQSLGITEQKKDTTKIDKKNFRKSKRRVETTV